MNNSSALFVPDRNHIQHLVRLRTQTVTVCALSLLIALTFISTPAVAVTRSWNEFGDGNFNDASKWFPIGVPTASDFINFSVGAGLNYKVTFPGNLVIEPPAVYTTTHLRVRADTVTFTSSPQLNRGPSSYVLSSTTTTESGRGIIIAESNGDQATLNISPSFSGLAPSLSGAAATIGDAVGSSGTVQVNVGTLNVTGSNFSDTELIVGNRGSGTLNLGIGGDLNVTGFNSRATLGNYATGVGTINVNGAGSTWTNHNELWIGANGTGTLNIQNGGSVVSSSAANFTNTIGTFPGSHGTVTIDGAGSTWTNDNTLRIGNSGDGTLMISNGGRLVNTNGFVATEIASGLTSTGSVMVTGPGSNWSDSGRLYVSNGGNGSLAIQNGATMSSHTSSVGINSGIGSVLVGGNGAAWTISGGLLSIAGNAQGAAPGQGTVIVNPGGTVFAEDIDLFANGTINLQGGRIVASEIGLQGLPFAGQFQWSSGTLSVGLFRKGLTNIGGVLAPAHATTIDGFYQQQTAGTLAIDIGGTTAGVNHDFVGVSGLVSLGGQLQVTVDNGFTPTEQQTFAVLASSGISGAFSNAPSGTRLATADGLGSFLVQYGSGSPLGPNQIVLSDFLASLVGDFDGDGSYACSDVDGLVAAIAGGTNPGQFDITHDGLVNSADLNQWLTIAGAVNNPSGGAYRTGDANLDGLVDGVDFIIWNSRKFTSTAAWCSGDFTADGLIDGQDFIVWNGNKFTSSDRVSAVPEPTIALPLASLILALMKRLR